MTGCDTCVLFVPPVSSLSLVCYAMRRSPLRDAWATSNRGRVWGFGLPRQQGLAPH